MELIETSPVPASALPISALREHLRLSSGFADDTTQDGLLEHYLRAAIARVEGRISRALLLRDFTWRLARWRDDYAQRLPIAPVAALQGVVLIDRAGSETPVAPDRLRLETDSARPRLVAAASALPMIPSGGAVRIAFSAGFGAAWDDIPADLRQAVLLLAAQYYERRDTGGADSDFAIAALLERWRDLRLGGRA
ncbi:MAG: hypothetical protein JJT99_12895 [Rhodobacteraceae bacterium]|nr:hypothetical protein [Paracoccaceae bacterium]